MALITREIVTEKLGAYLRHDLSLAELVSWAEGEFDPAHFATIREVVARLGVADVRAFGLAWEDCEQLLALLGYSARVNIVAR